MVAIEPGGNGMRTRVVLLGLLVLALLYPTSSDAVLRSRETRQAFAAPPLLSLRSGLLHVARNSDTPGSAGVSPRRASAPTVTLAPSLFHCFYPLKLAKCEIYWYTAISNISRRAIVESRWDSEKYTKDSFLGKRQRDEGPRISILMEINNLNL